MSIDLSAYLDIFADEANEHLQALNQALLEFEKDTDNLELVNVIFRSAHTLKGMSATMGFNEVAELTHNMENLLTPVRQGELKATGEIVDVLFKCLDALQDMIEAHIAGDEHSVDISAMVSEMQALSGDSPAPAKVDTSAQKDPVGQTGYPGDIGDEGRAAVSEAKNNAKIIYHVHVEVEADCELANARAFMVLRELKGLGQVIHSIPDETQITNEDFGTSFDLVLISDEPAEVVEEAAMSVSEIATVLVLEFGEALGADVPSGQGIGGIFSFSEYEMTAFNQAKADGFDIVYVQVTLADDCSLKSARAFMVNKQLETFGDIVAVFPDVEDIEFERFETDIHFLVITKDDTKPIGEAIGSISEIASFKVERNPSLSPARLPEASTAKGEAVGQPTDAGSSKPTAVEKVGPAKVKKTQTKGAEKHKVAQTIRVETERLDALLNLVGELVIGKTRLQQLASEVKRHDLSETVEHFSHIVFDLQNVVMQTRMVPIDTVFNRFPRMIRDLAKARGKQVELVMVGGATELDRTVIDEIGDPLVHLIRNALDHGIENVEERIAAGKPEKGILTLSAFHEGSHVFIEIKDDGKGIDHQKVRIKAVEKGIMTQEQVDALSDEQAMDLIFAAGLSTADKVTDISGRGVGMDAVKSKLETLNGTISVASEMGKGSTLKIKLPLTLAIVQALLVKVAGEDFAVPLAYIQETLRIHPEDIQKANQADVYVLRGDILPLVWMRDLMHSPDFPRDDDSWFVVVVGAGNNRAGLCVDSPSGQMEIVIKSLGTYLTNVKYISGGTILGDGTVALILDVAGIVS